MTRQEIAKELVQEMRHHMDGFGLAAATHAIDHTIDIIAAALIRGEAVTLRGFATLEPVTRRPRKARNISKGKVIELPARRDVRIKLCKAMKNGLEACIIPEIDNSQLNF